MEESSSSKAPRIAIKFGNGASKPNKSARPTTTKPTSLLGKRSRTAGLGDSDSEGSDEERNGKHEVISGFDGDKVVTKRDEEALKNQKAPLVIKPPPTRNWSDEIKASIARKAQVAETLDDSEKKIQWGLNVMKKQPTQESEVATQDQSTPVEAPAPKSVEDQALDRLLGNEEGPQRIIKPTETDAFKNHMKTAAEVPALEDYNDMPVEEFGAALLRGLGWDGKPNDAKTKAAVRRPNQLGLGAKELKGAEELGGWNNGNKKRPRLAEYNERRDKGRDDRTSDDRDKGRSGHHHHDRARKMDIERAKERDRQFDERNRSRRDDRDRGSDRDRNRDRDSYRRDRDRDRDGRSRGNGGRDRDDDRRDRDRNRDGDRDRHRSRQ